MLNHLAQDRGTDGSYSPAQGDGTWTYAYNPNGNEAWKTKSAEKWNYQFNSLDQLTKVVKGTQSKNTWTWTTKGEYWYDANGAMAKSVEGATTVDYLFLGHDPLYDKNGTVHTKYVYVGGRLVAKLIGSDAYAYLTDALGGVWQVWKSGANSAAFSVTSYKPFGIPIVSASTLSEKVRFAGEMQDSAIGGLYYIFARYMDPELGRWLSLDPELGKLSSPQTMNRYVYCVNNPLSYVDPTGTVPLLDLGPGGCEREPYLIDYGYWSFVDNYRWREKEFIAFGIVIVAGIAILATGGIASPGVAALVGGGIGASSFFASTYIDTGDLEASLESALWGGLAGGLTGGIGAKFAQGGLGAYLSSKFGPALSKLGLGFSKAGGKSPVALNEAERLFGVWMSRMEGHGLGYQVSAGVRALAASSEWKLVLRAVAAERLGHILFERVGELMSQRSTPMPAFGQTPVWV